MKFILDELTTANFDEAAQKWVNNPNNPNYWLDFNSATPNGDGTFTIICKCVKMPYDRVIEMFCDFVGASKTYNKETFSLKAPLDYWNKNCEGQRAMHPDSEKLIKKLLTTLSEKESLEDFVAWYNNNKENLQKKYKKDSLEY